VSRDAAPYDVIVVGAGPAGTFAARALSGLRTLVLDVGKRPGGDASTLDENQYRLKATGRHDLFATLIGERFESLHNVHREYLSPKLKAPLVRYVTDGWRELGPVVCKGFDPVTSFAEGGLANAWGAGCYRFTDDELHDFPITAADLDPHYDDLTAHIGVTGTDDDLAPFFGTASGCLPPHRTSRLGADVARRYHRRREAFRRAGVHIGAPRMAVLSVPHRGRPAYDYQGLEFFKPHIRAIYNPAFTLRELVDEGAVEVERPYLVETFREDERGVTVTARHVETGEHRSFRARALVLAAGTLNTSRIVLASQGDTTSRLPLLDNMISYVPFVSLRHIGSGVEHESLPIQLNIVLEDEAEPAPVQASYYGVTPTLWNDILFDLPLAYRDNTRMLRLLLPAMSVAQVFYPDRATPTNFLQRRADGALRLEYEAGPRGAYERRLIRLFRRFGYLSTPSLCKYPLPGNSFHYAGSLPMQRDPGPRATDPSGRLGGTRAVHVADAACFSSLPSKNLTFTIMANAARIGTRLRTRLTAGGDLAGTADGGAGTARDERA
jgi:choline dehydrogenase-like flavoprotein